MAEQSIYEWITQNIKEGRLSEGCVLEQLDEDGNILNEGLNDAQLYFSDIAELTAAETAPVIEAVKKASAGKYKEADRMFAHLGDKCRAIIASEDMQQYVLEHPGRFDPDKLYDAGEYLMKCSSNVESVKYGMMLLELFDIKDRNLKQAVRNIGLCSEFTFFSICLMKYWENAAEEIFKLATVTDGYGKVFAVTMMDELSDEITTWMFKEGWKNKLGTALCSQIAWTKGNASGVMRGEVDEEQFVCLRNMMDGMLEATVDDEELVAGVVESDVADFLHIAGGFADEARQTAVQLKQRAMHLGNSDIAGLCDKVLEA